jgi:hypothetical protein
MPDILLRNVPPHVADYWKERARKHNRSLQQELQTLLSHEEERDRRREESSRRIDEFQKSLAGRTFSDSAELIREDRDTDHGHDW